MGAPASLTYGNTATLTASGGSGTGAVTFSTGSSTGCAVSGAILSVTDASGTCAVTASKAGDNNYNPATSAAATVTLQQASQTITVTQAAPATAVFNTPFSVAATASSGLPVAVGAFRACSANGTTITMTSGTGKCAVTFNQAGNGNYAAAPQIVQITLAQKATQIITVIQGMPATAAVNNKFPVAATASSGLPVKIGASGACSIKGKTVTTASKPGTCTVTFVQAGNGNYAAAPQVVQTTTVKRGRSRFSSPKAS